MRFLTKLSKMKKNVQNYKLRKEKTANTIEILIIEHEVFN